ncbi:MULTISPECIES: hypothetical protein [Actinomadura]|uniref:hypothetical protein n=1 Tax=Actinomadura TaxID=1988 RepID=UPI0003AD6009|nr:hypothetical protein [Actinomadura madurae]
MSNVPPPSGPQGPQGPPAPGAPPAPGFAASRPQSYAHTTRTPVVHLPVMLNGLHIGYLWAGMDDRSAGFVRRNEFLEQAFEAPAVWSRRLRDAHAQGLPSREAIRQWAGRPEDPRGGGVPAGAPEETADGTRALSELANPGGERHSWDSFRHGEFPDGTPMDRSEGWGPLHFELPPGYDLTTDGPVRYLPVVEGDLVLGYLWAGGAAALFLPRADAAAPGGDAMGAWVQRLRDLYAENVPVADVLDRARAMPADPVAGAVPADAAVREAPNLQALRDRADVHEQSLRLAGNPVPGDPDVLKRPALDAAEREAVLRYLREAPVVYDSGRHLTDGFDPARPSSVPDTYQTDGTWIWFGGVPHHLEHHGVAPEPDLLQHVRAHNAQLPLLDAAAHERAKRTLRLHRILVPPPV